MDYNESHIKTTLKVTSANKEEMEKLILEMLRIGGIDELTSSVALIQCGAL